MSQAIGLLETRGLVASIEAADAMLKASNVSLTDKQRADAGLITIIIEGDTAAVKSSLDAGAEAAKRVGELVSVHIIPKPDDQLSIIIPFSSPTIKEKKTETKQPVVKGKSGASKSAKPSSVTPRKIDKEKEEKKKPEEIKPEPEIEVKTEKEIDKNIPPIEVISSSSTIERLRREALSKEERKKEEVKNAKKSEEESEEKGSLALSMKEIEDLNVHELRKLARNTDGFPIQGRDISKANRAQLLVYFRGLK